MLCFPSEEHTYRLLLNSQTRQFLVNSNFLGNGLKFDSRKGFFLFRWSFILNTYGLLTGIPLGF
jgi:hypothetical protein